VDRWITMPEKGVQFRRMGKKNGMRSVYQQNNGDYILADECKCKVDFSIVTASKYVPMTVTRVPNCPIDEHRAAQPTS
jgi:hypothetical protein